MIIRDILNPQAIAIQRTEAGSNKIPYLGNALFPSKKKDGLDLKWIRTHKGLPVSLAPSTFDSKATLRSREGFKIIETEMPFFREAKLVKEQDRMDLRRVRDMNDPLYLQVLNSIYDDVNELLDGADVVPERMIWQLLASETGKPGISISANGASYVYDYDPNNTWAEKNYLDVTTTAANKWSETTSDPLADVQTLQDQIEEETGTRPNALVVSLATMAYLRQNEVIRSAILAQNQTANIFMTDGLVKDVFNNLLGVTLTTYSKKYKDEDGVSHAFYPDGYATLIPTDAPLGSMWYGVTPEEDAANEESDFAVTVINNKVAVAVQHSLDPVQTKTIASEILLPSFERMDECGLIKCY